jgi:hypothetical protein
MHPDANIAAVPEVARMQIADLKLHGGTLQDALEALRVASGYRFMWHLGLMGAPATLDPQTGLSVAANGSSLYVLDLGESQTVERTTRHVEVFNLSGYLSTMVAKQPAGGGGPMPAETAIRDIEKIIVRDIERIIVGTLEGLNRGSAAASEPPDFQFHPGAGLLIVIGPTDAIDVARRVLSALPGVSGGGSGSGRGFGGGFGGPGGIRPGVGIPSAPAPAPAPPATPASPAPPQPPQ